MLWYYQDLRDGTGPKPALLAHTGPAEKQTMIGQKKRTRAPAFTLVELLTVIAIITLLIGILVPSLSAARAQATRTAVKAQLNAIQSGTEMFRNDENKYPESNPYAFGVYGNAANQNTAVTNWEVVDTSGGALQGAHLIVDAMIGRDSLGYDPKPGTGPGASVASRWYSGAPGAGEFPRARRNAYIKPEGIALANSAKPPQDAYGTYPVSGATNTLPQADAADSICPTFADKFGFPVLYYRANPRANQQTPIIQSPVGTPIDARVSDGVYDGRDNLLFTDGSAPAVAQHRIKDGNVNSYDYTTDIGQVNLRNNFAEFIRSFRATSYIANTNPAQVNFPRPVNGETFVLLSAGKDGIYGTLDDVANFEVLSEER